MIRAPLKIRVLVACLAGAVPFAALGASTASWFEAPYKGIAPLKRTGDLLTNNANTVQFDINPRALLAGIGADDAVEAVAEDSLQFYGVSEPSAGRTPAQSLGDVGDTDPALRKLSNVAVSWERRFDALNRFSLSAGYTDSLTGRPAAAAADLGDTHAGMSWTHQLPGSWRPSLTGSVFLGDEFAREEAYRHLGRRYLGFAVEGQMTLLKSHTPYLSFQMRRSYYEAMGLEDSMNGALRTDDRQLVSAGWRWQATRSLSLQAEASYGLNPTGQDLYNPERARVLFGTRFDFR
jgi:hypothetical protein